MTSPGPRFCPRCGTARVADMAFCPGCGLNLTGVDEGAALGAERQPAPVAVDLASVNSTAPAATSQSSRVADVDRGWPSDSARATTTTLSRLRGFRVPPILIVALIVLVGLVILGILPRPQLGGSPGSGGQAAPGVASGGPAAPIIGFTILSPADGQAVASKDVVVIGTAPPGLTITQDISFGLDQHATVDGTGHWAITAGLSEGDNKLTFRIGDDHSTQQTIRVIYTPPKTP
jgi:hypothetical protein